MREIRVFIEREEEKREGVIEIRVHDSPERDEIKFRRLKVCLGERFFLFTFRFPYGTYTLGGIGRVGKQLLDEECRISQDEKELIKNVLHIVDKTFSYPIFPSQNNSPDLPLF